MDELFNELEVTAANPHVKSHIRRLVSAKLQENYQRGLKMNFEVH